MLMKNLYKFYSSADIHWVNIVWRAHYQNGDLANENYYRGSFWWRDCI
jgi:hypothetical protein